MCKASIGLYTFVHVIAANSERNSYMDWEGIFGNLSPASFFNFSFMGEYGKYIFQALGYTLLLAVVSVALAILPALLLAIMRLSKNKLIKGISGAYIAAFRSTPLLVQLFFLYFALPRIGIRIPAEVCGWVGLGLIGGAYMTETFRSGLDSIARIQTESAASLGMTRFQIFRYVVLPQALASSIPGILANIIFLLKETSVFSTISLMDLMFTAKDLIGMYAKTLECLTLLVIFYLIMLLPVSVAGSIIERRLRYAEFGN